MSNTDFLYAETETLPVPALLGVKRAQEGKQTLPGVAFEDNALWAFGESCIVRLGCPRYFHFPGQTTMQGKL